MELGGIPPIELGGIPPMVLGGIPPMGPGGMPGLEGCEGALVCGKLVGGWVS